MSSATATTAEAHNPQWIKGSASRDPAQDRKPRVCLLSDVRLYREGLLWHLARQQAFEVVGAADVTEEGVARAVALRPEVTIVDIRAPNSFALAKSLRNTLPSCKVIAFAVTEIDQIVLACAEAGIAGYVPPGGSEQDLITAVEYALRGELYCSPRIAGLLLRRVTALSAQPISVEESTPLTRRERQILGLVGEGMSNKEIGRALQIGHSTVKNHVHSILEKLQVSRRSQAAVRLRAMELAFPDGNLQRRLRAEGADPPALTGARLEQTG